MKLTGLGENDGVQVNAVFTAICLMMGVWPCIYSALLIPSARSGNKASNHTQISSRSNARLVSTVPKLCCWQTVRHSDLQCTWQKSALSEHNWPSC